MNFKHYNQSIKGRSELILNYSHGMMQPLPIVKNHCYRYKYQLLLSKRSLAT